MAAPPEVPPSLPGSREDTRPVPDPTVLTTEQVKREIAALRELLETKSDVLETKIQGNRELVEVRLHGMDEAIKIRQLLPEHVLNSVDYKLAALKSLHEEKFDSIATQFNERDVRTEQTARDSKVAVDAALQAAKEAVGEQNKSSALSIAKSEAATTKQIDQIGMLVQSTTSGLNDKIDDIKQRLTQIEGQDRGKQTAVTTQQTSNTSLVSIIGLVFGVLIGVGGIVIGAVTHYSK